MVTEIGDRHPQDVLEAVSRNETVLAGGGRRTIEDPITVTTPGVTLSGLDLRLADGADGNAIEVAADGVRLTDFRIDGDRDNQPGERTSNGVVVAGATDVTVERGRIGNTSRHGVLVLDTTTTTAGGTIDGNVTAVAEGATRGVTVRDLRVESPRRDGCSVEGPAVENVRVENVRTFDSGDRGGVEIKDGTTDAVVAGCYAERCRYGVAVQDHGDYGVGNVVVANTQAVACETVVDAQTHPREDLLEGHESVTVVGNVGRELSGEGMGGPGAIYMGRIDGLVVANNLIERSDNRGIVVEDTVDTTVTGNVVRGVDRGPGIDLRGTSGALVEGNTASGGSGDGIRCRGTAAELLVSTNRCTDNGGAGIRIAGDSGRLEHALVATNLVAGNGDGGVVGGAGGATLVNNLD